MSVNSRDFTPGTGYTYNRISSTNTTAGSMNIQSNEDSVEAKSYQNAELEKYETGKTFDGFSKKNSMVKDVGYDGGNGASDIINSSAYYASLRHSNGLHSAAEIDLYNKIYRYGLMNPYNVITTGREYLFFTKPELHIYKSDEESGLLTGSINEELAGYSFWEEMCQYRKMTIAQLQDKFGKEVCKGDPFNNLLRNSCISNLEVPGLQSEMVDSATNMYGVSISYRGSSEASNDSPEFSLEFKDTKWLDVYWFFRAYEEYETMKHHGVISPYTEFISKRIIHDAFSIYKFIVDEDMETIIYWGKMYGVVPKSLPRDVFSSPTFDQGLSYSIDFKGSFYEDMRTEILVDFNNLAIPYGDAQGFRDIPIYNTVLNRVDGRPARTAYIAKYQHKSSPTGYVYKLKWKGSDNL